jgi:hypothetical protein
MERDEFEMARVPSRRLAKDAVKSGARGDVELCKPPPQERSEERRQRLALPEIDDHELAARPDMLPGMGDGALPGRDHRQRVGEIDPVEG